MDDAPPPAASPEELRCEAEQLRASLGRVVAASDDERRRIERELHDGVLQQLVALAVSLQLARGLLDVDSSGLRALLDEMSESVQEALDGVRRLAWRVYPSLLLDRSLGEALATAASEAGIPTRVDAAMLARLAPESEAAIYFCCVELLDRAADGGRRATVRLRSEPDHVLLEVAVDGAGPETWTAGDLRAVSDRLAALGGKLELAPTRGEGILVSGTLPLAPAGQPPVAERSSTSAR